MIFGRKGLPNGCTIKKNLQLQTNNFCFGYIALSCYFVSFPGDQGVWVCGWLVGKSDFNENPVVSLDLDFGLRLRVCQKYDFARGELSTPVKPPY